MSTRCYSLAAIQEPELCVCRACGLEYANLQDLSSHVRSHLPQLAPFKHGAFTMAIEHQVPMVPLSFLDNKKRFPWSYGGLIGASKGSPGTCKKLASLNT